MEILDGSDGFEALIHTENYKPRQMKMTLNLKMSDVNEENGSNPISTQSPEVKSAFNRCVQSVHQETKSCFYFDLCN